MSQFQENSLKPCFSAILGQTSAIMGKNWAKKDFSKYNKHRRIIKLLIFLRHAKNQNILIDQFREKSLKPCFRVIWAKMAKNQANKIFLNTMNIVIF